MEHARRLALRFFVTIAPMPNHKKPFLCLLSLFLFLSACASNAPTDAPPTESIFITAPTGETPAPVVETPPPTNTPPPALERAKYTLDTLMDYDAHTVTVDETIQYPNLTGNQLNNLVLAVTPNLWDGSFILNS
ncbi:MAG: hypothetical protein DYG85_17705, partial [Chloroflexi bacterium CFX1]|nr:hypothetical protein [Chloroflexi bacterium CFX1]